MKVSGTRRGDNLENGDGIGDENVNANKKKGNGDEMVNFGGCLI